MQQVQNLKKISGAALNQNSIAQCLTQLNLQNTWQYQKVQDVEYITRIYKMQNFKHAVLFMNKAGFVAESMIHHPEWSNVWNTINVNLTTHDPKGLTLKDLYLAYCMENIHDDMQQLNKDQIKQQYEFIHLDVLKGQEILDSLNQQFNKLV